tara:strand:- start:4767 stop:7307 length:2541 start_codon:yes stop_codon:yes gene_type:complete
MTTNRISVLAAPIAILALFGSTIVGKDRLAFRDVSHFYTPLYDYVAERTSDDWIPLWNPLDATGMPLLGETTTAVLYPFRYIIFALPISTESAMAVYVVVHLLLASYFASLAARWAGASASAAPIAGIIYPLSGSVLFLYCNPPFLVGATWLPLVIAALTTRRPLSPWNRVRIAAPALAMMVTGGDPQTALHAMLVVSVFWCSRRIKQSREGTSLFAIVAAGALAAALAAPQIAASIAWSRQSERVSVEDESWFSPPAPSGRRFEAYQFSLPPWHTAELLTPNAIGTLFPVNHRISALIPGDGRMWTPTIYVGAIATLAFFSCIFRRFQFPRTGRPWMCLAAISLFLSMGHFGAVWWLQQIPGVLPNTDSAVAGPYWLLYQVLPGYDAFRYPTKWLPLFSLGASIAVAITVDEVRLRQDGRHQHRAAALLGLLLLVGISVTGWQSGSGHPQPISGDEFWGPIDWPGACREIASSHLHSATVLFAMCVLFFVARRRQWKRSSWIAVLSVIVACDLYVASTNLIAKIDRRDETQLTESAPLQASTAANQKWMRTQSGGGWPKEWRTTNSSTRLGEVEASGRVAWFGRWHLADRVSVLNGMVTIRSRAMANFWKASHVVTASMSSSSTEQYWQSVRKWLSVDNVLHTSDRSRVTRLQNNRFVMVDATARTERRSRHPFRFDTDWKSFDEDPASDDFVQLLQDVHATSGSPRSRIRASRELHAEPKHSVDVPLMDSYIQHADQTEIYVRNSVAGLLVRPTLQDGAWTAEISPIGSTDWTPIEVLPVNFITQGIHLPPGDWNVRFRYRPAWLSWSLTVAGIAWLALIISLCRRFLTNTKPVIAAQIAAVPH